MSIPPPHIEKLKEVYPSAAITQVSGGSLISIPGFSLPAGWSKEITEIRFLAPAGYPFAQPDCFWADSDLRLANGNLPQASNLQFAPDGRPQVWFSWHVTQWNPNSDSLLTYIRVIKNRLAAPR